MISIWLSRAIKQRSVLFYQLYVNGWRWRWRNMWLWWIIGVIIEIYYFYFFTYDEKWLKIVKKKSFRKFSLERGKYWVPICISIHRVQQLGNKFIKLNWENCRDNSSTKDLQIFTFLIEFLQVVEVEIVKLPSTEIDKMHQIHASC
jgi:hypothetical protein